MTWHILRKDWRLLWPLAIAIGACDILMALLGYLSEPQATRTDLVVLLGLLSAGALIGTGVLIVLAVQQDATPGVDQDWLVRPIRRRDLVLAKLLFVLLVIHGPMIVVGVLHGLADGFGFGPSVGAALTRNAYLVLVFSLPLLTAAALTRSLTEVIVGGLAVLAAIVVALLLAAAVRTLVVHSHHWDSATLNTDVAWVWQAVSLFVLLVGMAAAVVLQYSRRNTLLSRAVFLGALLLSLLVRVLPWGPAFTVQSWLAEKPSLNRGLAIAFDPAAGPGHVDDPRPPADNSPVELPHEDATGILLPMRLAGVPSEKVLHADRVAVRLVDARGTTVYRGTGSGFDIPAGEGAYYQGIRIPTAIYRSIKAESLRVEVEYSLTLLALRTLPPIPALGADQTLPGIGRCATRVDDSGTAIEVGCMAAGELPACLSMVLEQPRSGQRNPVKLNCPLDYAPLRTHFSLDALSHSSTRLPFQDPSGAAHYPVGPGQLQDAQIVMTVYEPDGHLSRNLTIPSVSLQDWQVSTAGRFP